MTVKLEIHLQDGFKDDTVAVSVNGREVARKENVSTKLLVGYAEIIRTEVTGGEISIEVQIPNRNLTERATVNAGETPYVAVSIRGSRLEIKASKERIGYM